MAKDSVRLVCPVCKDGRDFIRVVEAHIETSIPRAIGIHSHDWVKRTSQPLAYCQVCSVVVFIGPTAEEVEKDYLQIE